MRVAERDVAILLSEDGRKVLRAAAVDVAEHAMVSVYVQDADDMGLWTRIQREDGEHLLLIRWEYVCSLDFPVGEQKSIGLKG